MKPRVADDRGETLIELLVAIMITGIAVVVLLGGLGTSIRMSGIHRQQAVAGARVRAFAEAVEAAVDASPTGYVECADTTTYAGAYTSPDPAYAATVVAVRYWSGSAFGTACTTATDSGIQQLSLRVSSSDGMVDENLVIIIRKPCRTSTAYPLDAPCS
jgi:type II secretory pathway pseudopilin PulG